MYFKKNQELKAKEYAISQGVNTYFDPGEQSKVRQREDGIILNKIQE